jgi:plasmid maintenance system antidote protein VapI
LGDLIRRLCNEHGRKAYWVAAQLGMHPATFRRVLSGDRELSRAEANRLGEIFGVPPTTFLPEDSHV